MKFKVIGSYTEFCPGGRCFDVYDGDHSGWLVFLANAYIDLGTWWCLTPFVGAGVGARLSHDSAACHDIGLISDGATGFGYATSDSRKWSFAWALHAGVAYNVTNNFKVELAYRYLNMGTLRHADHRLRRDRLRRRRRTARLLHPAPTIDSHDLKIGMRWMLQPEPAAGLRRR